MTRPYTCDLSFICRQDKINYDEQLNIIRNEYYPLEWDEQDLFSIIATIKGQFTHGIMFNIDIELFFSTHALPDSFKSSIEQYSSIIDRVKDSEHYKLVTGEMAGFVEDVDIVKKMINREESINLREMFETSIKDNNLVSKNTKKILANSIYQYSKMDLLIKQDPEFVQLVQKYVDKWIDRYFSETVTELLNPPSLRNTAIL